MRQIYATQVATGDHLERADGMAFSRADFRSNPHLFKSTFSEKVMHNEVSDVKSFGLNKNCPQIAPFTTVRWTPDYLKDAHSSSRTPGGVEWRILD